MLTEMQMTELRSALTALEKELVDSLSSNEQSSKPVDLGLSIGRLSRMDAMQQQQMAMAQKQRKEQQRQQIRAALRRIDDGVYGECLNCGEDISYPRLKIKPEAPLCMDCQRGGK